MMTKTAIIFFLTTAIREKPQNFIIKPLKFIKKALSLSLRASQWLLECFQNKLVIKEFFIDCTEKDMRRFVAGILKTALENVYHNVDKVKHAEEYTKLNEKQAPSSLVLNFIHLLINTLPETLIGNRDSCEFFMLFDILAGMGHEINIYMVKKMVIGRLLDIFYDKSSNLNKFFRNYDKVPCTEVAESGIGLPKHSKKNKLTDLEEQLQKRGSR